MLLRYQGDQWDAQRPTDNHKVSLFKFCQGNGLDTHIIERRGKEPVNQIMAIQLLCESLFGPIIYSGIKYALWPSPFTASIQFHFNQFLCSTTY